MTYKNIVIDGYPLSVPYVLFQETEKNIGVRLPKIFYDLIKNHDQGFPVSNSVQILYPGESTPRINGLHAFIPFNSMFIGNMVNAYFDRPDHFPQDERFVPFGMTGNGDYFLFFYEKGKDDPQPKVYYWAHEYSDINGGLVFLANSFEEFLNMLKPEGYYD